MKKSFVFVAVALFAMAGLVGCGGNDPTDPDGTVDVNPSLTFKTGDKFTYEYYDRNEDNSRNEDSKSIVVWTVVNTGVSVDGRSDAVEVEEIRYEADGTTIKETNTVYLAANGQGQVFQYNVLKLILERFDSDALDLLSVLNQLPDIWSQISDVKSPSASSWSSLGDLLVPVDGVDLAGVATLNITVDMSGTASHKGRMSTTVPAGTYEKSYVTDHAFPVTIKANESKVIITGVLEVETGDDLILATGGNAMELHYAVDIDGGILSMSMDSKEVAVIPLGSQGAYPINGFEMVLTAVERVETE